MTMTSYNSQAGGSSEMSEWISVNDRLPEDRGDVLAVVFWHETWQVKMAWCVPERKEWSVHVGFADRNDVQVSHWRPLPKPLEEVTE